ncbi:MAG: hypothetical protein GY851_35610 [bacterium]|nr:hypothetical protein [bacterium]
MKREKDNQEAETEKGEKNMDRMTPTEVTEQQARFEAFITAIDHAELRKELMQAGTGMMKVAYAKCRTAKVRPSMYHPGKLFEGRKVFYGDLLLEIAMEAFWADLAE